MEQGAGGGGGGGGGGEMGDRGPRGDRGGYRGGRGGPREPEGFRRPNMAWESPIDRGVLKEIDLAGPSPIRQADASALVHALLQLNPRRPESYFTLGYLNGSHGLSLDAYKPEELQSTESAWFKFGQTLGKLRHPKEGQEQPDVKALLMEPLIAKEILPILLRQSLGSGNLEEAVATLEGVLATGAPDAETAELLRGTLGEVLRRAERPGEHFEPAAVQSLLQRCMTLPGFDALAPEIRAPFHRALGKLQQHLEQFDVAADHFKKALEVAGEGHTLASVLHFDLAACALGLRGVPDLEPQAERKGREEALAHLDQATADAKSASFNAFFTRGILRFERGMNSEAAQDFRDALERIEQYRNPLPVTLARIRFFLALSLLREGKPENADDATRHLETALERLRPSDEQMGELMPLLEEKAPRAAARLLARVDVASISDPKQLLEVGKHFQRLGDSERALKIAEQCLERSEDLGVRKDALLVELRAFNMAGERENAADALYDLRDVCYQSGDLAFWESVIFDDDRVGQALDRARTLSERAELLAQLRGREKDRFAVIRQLADLYLSRAEPQWKLTGLRLLKDAYRANPDEFEADVKKAEADSPKDDRPNDKSAADKARDAIGRRPNVMVIGGDEHQTRGEDELAALGAEWGFDSEWWPTDYVNPDRVTDKLQEHLNSRQPDGLLILHWNREELVRELRKLAKTYRVAARFCIYVGAQSLRAGIADLMDAAVAQFADKGDAAAASSSSY
jgi:tetratricopeptide (TPR) repeat protein